jgi:uncharacterized membrane protein YdjX (TVP38/TMEM64 family)
VKRDLIKRLPWRWIALAVLAAAAIGFAYHELEPMADWTGLVEEWIDRSGALGVLVFIAIYVVATLALLPVSAVLNVIAGAMFGFGWGFTAVNIASMIAALIAFEIARHLLRERIKRHYTHKGTPAAIDRALRSEGWRAVTLLRLSPVIPFAVKNYLFGVSRVRLRDYLVGTFLGKLPGAFIFTALGTTGRAAMDLPPQERWALIAFGLGATFLVTWLVGRTARRRLGLT